MLKAPKGEENIMEDNNMTLGQRIASYRGRAHLSQDSLAELLDVSRQSVSKWETDASVPELSKLVRLGQVFDVSLDELVTGETKAVAPDPQQGNTNSTQDALAMPETLRLHRQKITGIVLLTVLGVACLLQFGLIMLVWPLLVLGLLCLVTKRVTGLGAGWLLWLAAVAMCYGLTSVNLLMVFHRYAYGALTIQLIIAWFLWLALAMLVWVTCRRFRREKETLPGWPVIAVMAAVWVAVMLLYWHVFGLPFHRNALSYLMGAALIFLIVLKLLKSENG